ncbi:hypothetical protein [Rickettsia sp. MEAM1 (Bemisia tabaci)]|uniref:hypothetical protein n=1 Tax=Rickettsia sp. MEAM1 (Bemisia tabaci) TaxID=1182263 RepID=UPI001EE77A5A|nr:hypothetical protein [Rickettsia sp. MEAM1 (Bemisia tabaci)]
MNTIKHIDKFASERLKQRRIAIGLSGTVKLSKLVSQSTIFLDFRQQEVFE